MVLAAVVAEADAAPVALPALRADAAPGLAGAVRAAVQAATLWKGIMVKYGGPYDLQSL